MRLLIVKLGAIGDIVHALPALHQIRSHSPDIFIGWAVERRSAEILRGNPLIDRLIEIDTKSVRKEFSNTKNISEVKKQFSELRDPNFDIAIDLQGLLKSAAIAKLSKAKSRWGFSKRSLREPASRILLTDMVEIPVKTHIIRKNLILVQKALQLNPSAVGAQIEFPIFTDESHKMEALQIIEPINKQFAILNPGGGWPTKLWPEENFGLLADRLYQELGLVSVITHGPGEDHLTQRAFISSRSGHTIVAELSLKGFYELAKRSSIYVGGDTGPTHIAAAAKAPIVGLFGPTEWWRNGSLDPADICVERNEIPCRVNCHRRSCSAWICMDISVESVLTAVKHRLSLVRS